MHTKTYRRKTYVNHVKKKRKIKIEKIPEILACSTTNAHVRVSNSVHLYPQIKAQLPLKNSLVAKSMELTKKRYKNKQKREAPQSKKSCTKFEKLIPNFCPSSRRRHPSIFFTVLHRLHQFYFHRNTGSLVQYGRSNAIEPPPLVDAERNTVTVTLPLPLPKPTPSRRRRADRTSPINLK